jgi:hypothetical protein
MAHVTRALAVGLLTLPLAVGCARAARDQRVGEAPAPPPPSVPAPLTEGQAPVPIPDHPPVTTSGVVASFDGATRILSFEDGRMVKLTDQTRVVEPGGTQTVRPGERVVLQDVLPVGVRSGFKTLASGRGHRMGTVASVDESSGLVRLTDGTAVRVTGTTNVHMGAAGSSVILRDLRPGDEVMVVLGGGAEALPGAGPTAVPGTSGADATASPSALPRQVAPPAVEAGEVMIFRHAPRR